MLLFSITDAINNIIPFILGRLDKLKDAVVKIAFDTVVTGLEYTLVPWLAPFVAPNIGSDVGNVLTSANVAFGPGMFIDLLNELQDLVGSLVVYVLVLPLVNIMITIAVIKDVGDAGGRHRAEIQPAVRI